MTESDISLKFIIFWESYKNQKSVGIFPVGQVTVNKLFFFYA